MKIDEFQKYRRIVESEKSTHFFKDENLSRVHKWLDESGRLDEGILSGIWSWLKRNFSVTARRIHSLADDYEKELGEELRAEWKKTKDPKDLASKFRAGTYNRASRDIAERMEILAEDDQDYRELVRTISNKKTMDKNNGYRTYNGCGADKEGGKIFNTFFYPELQSKHVSPLAYNLPIDAMNSAYTPTKLK